MVHRISGQGQTVLGVLGSGYQIVYALTDFQDTNFDFSYIDEIAVETITLACSHIVQDNQHRVNPIIPIEEVAGKIYERGSRRFCNQENQWYTLYG